jgi:TonB-dependent receptor
MQVLSFIKKIFFVCLFVPFIAFGQATLSGSVTDTVNNELLIGASVFLQGTSLGAATDIEGKFRISGIPERVFSVKVSYVGYEPKIIEIDFSVKKDVYIDIRLKPTVIKGEEVIVTAQMRGQLAAINQQITSRTIVNVVSEEKIQELPDANAAEAIGRLPGVSIIRSGGEATNIVMRGLSSKFSNITVDGVKIPPTDPTSRVVDLSMVSQGALAGIELYKTLTPDQDADAIAGGINMVTRKAPSERLIRADIKGSYNKLMKSSKQYDLSLRYGERFFNDVLGLQLQGNSERKIRSQENLSYGYDTNRDRPLLPGEPPYDMNVFHNNYFIDQFTVRFTDEVRKRNGLQAIIDVNTRDIGSVKLSGVYAETNRDYMIFEREYLTWLYNFEKVVQNTKTRNVSLQGKNFLMGLTVDWNASYAESKVTNPEDFRTMFYETDGGSNIDIKTNPVQLISLAHNNFANALLDSMDLYRIGNFDKEQTAQINISKRFTQSNIITHEIKLGVKYKAKSRWLDNYGYSWNTYQFTEHFHDPSGALLDFSGTPWAASGSSSHKALAEFTTMGNIPMRNLLGLYTMKPLIDVDRYSLWQSLVKDATMDAAINNGPLGTNVLSNYFVKENVSAAYLMDNIDIGQSVSLLIGARVESEKDDYKARYCNNGISGTGNVITITPRFIIDTTANYQKTIWLPNAQLNFKPTDYLTLRFAAYKAIARPDFNLRLPQLSYTYVGQFINITVGNPKLENAAAWNYEANAQIYSGTIGLISVNAYYKRIENLFHQINRNRVEWESDPNKVMGWYNRIPNTEVGYYRLDNMIDDIGLSEWRKTTAFANVLRAGSYFRMSAAYNSPNPSYAWGFEFEHQLNFRFIPVKFFQHMTLSYNIAIARSKTNIWLEKLVMDTVYDAAILDPRSGDTLTPEGYTLKRYHESKLYTKPMEDQPQLFGNVALGYDLAKFSARLSMFYQSRYTRSYSADGTSDAVVGEFIKWDLSLKYEITTKIALMFNVDNMFNRTETRYQYNNVFNWGYIPTSESSYGTTLDLGLRVSL